MTSIRDVTPGWILIHSDREFHADAQYKTPQAELRDIQNKRGLHWHWSLPRAMKDDGRPYRLLLSWKGSVFGEAVASITRQIDDGWRDRYNFAFVFWSYRWRLGSPLTTCRSGHDAPSTAVSSRSIIGSLTPFSRSNADAESVLEASSKRPIRYLRRVLEALLSTTLHLPPIRSNFV